MPGQILGFGGEVPVPPLYVIRDPQPETWSIITAGGDTIPLSSPSSGLWLQPGMTGADAPPFQVTTIPTPGRAGSVLSGVRAAERILSMVLQVRADNTDDYKTRTRRLVAQLDPRQGDLTIRCQQSDGTGRTIKATYLRGLEGDKSVDAGGVTWQRYAVQFVAVDPFWTGATMVAETWENIAPVNVFPAGPIVLSPATSLGDLFVYNGGDNDAYPVWTFTGPFTQIQVINVTTGRHFTLTVTKTSSDTVTVDTEKLIVVDQVPNNLWPDLSALPDLWPMVPGTNEISLIFAGDNPSTTASVQFAERFLTS